MRITEPGKGHSDKGHSGGRFLGKTGFGAKQPDASRPIAVLVPASSSPMARAVAKQLEGAGHIVHRCVPQGDGYACIAIRGGSCPLDVAPIAVAVSTPDASTRHASLAEHGIACALFRKIPVVMTGDVEISPYARWATAIAPISDVQEVVERTAAESLPEHSIRATAALRRELSQRRIDPGSTMAEVVRSGNGLKVKMKLDPRVPRDLARTASINVVRAVRAVDRWARAVDVSLDTADVASGSAGDRSGSAGQ